MSVSHDLRMEHPSAADIYHQRFVPALFQPWAAKLALQAQLQPGMRVLDVGCGTGVLALAAAGIVGATQVSGVDLSEDMLRVARQQDSRIDWHCAPAQQLPFDDASFDAVLSQFALMFFDPPAQALAEMWRVVKPGGKLQVAVCDAVHRSPGYAVLAELLLRLFGDAVANQFRAPFSAGDADYLYQIAQQAGLTEPRVDRLPGLVTFDSIAELVAAERACVFTLGGLLDERQFARLADEADIALAPFVNPAGQVQFALPALVLTAIKPRD